MDFQNITLADYANYNGSLSGDYNQQDVEMLYKAMSAGQITGRETDSRTDVSGAGLKVESLENTMKVLTNQPKHTPLFYRIGKKAAHNTVEEYNQLISYGDLPGGSTLEGELPEAADSIYRRKSVLIKYYGITGGVTHQMQLVTTGSGVSNMLAQETKNKVADLVKILEKSLPFADADKVPSEFNGFFAQHQKEGDFSTTEEYFNSEVVVDLRGSVLTDTAIEKGSLGVVDAFGLSDMLISSPRTFSNFVTRYHKNKWIQPVPSQVRDGVFGQRVNEIITQNGAVEIMQSNFFKFSKRKKTTDQAESSKAPSAPIADGTTPATSAPDAFNKFDNFTGDYYYAVSAKNRYGESAITLLGGGLVSIAAGNSADLKWTAGTSNGVSPTCYCVYRTKINPLGTPQESDFFKIFEVSVTEHTNGYDGGAAGIVRDRNRILPDTDQAMLIEWDSDQVIAWKQLAPMMKMNLAIVAPISRFMVLCYGTPVLYAPKKMIRFINIGDSLQGL